MRRHFASAIITTFSLVLGGSAAAQNWVDITPASGPAPAARGYSSAVLDTQNRRMIVYAGRNGSTFLADIWAFDLATQTWTDLTPASGSPLKRRTPGSEYDPAGHRMVMWSGQGSGGFFNDVWEFDLTSNQWHQFTPVGGPPNIRYGVATAFDPVEGDLVTFAGFTNLGRFDDTWRFKAADSSWTDVSPVTGPLERCLHSAVYDSQKHRLIMYGGQNAGALDDIWAFDLTTNTWSEFMPDSVPPGRFFAAHVYDSANNRSTIFGGNTSPTFVNDVILFDLWTEQWTEITPSGTPPDVREGACAVYDGEADRMVIFGGKNSLTYFGDVWALENLSNTVTSVAPNPVAANTARLKQNVPNPFNPSTSITFEIRTPGEVLLRVFDIRGRYIRTIARGHFDAGPHTATWNGRDDSGSPVASGVYFYQLDTGEQRMARRMVLLK